MFVCPHCHKQVKNLKEHLKRVHPDNAGAPKSKPTPVVKSKPEPKSQAKKFEMKVPKEEKSTYKCGACGASLNSEVTPCPYCGAELNWS